MLQSWRKIFIESLRRSGSVSAACESANISRTTAYYHRCTNPAFQSEWDLAVEGALDDLERAALEMAKDKNPAMLKFVLQARIPGVYKFFRGREYREGNPINWYGMTDEKFEETISAIRAKRKELDRLMDEYAKKLSPPVPPVRQNGSSNNNDKEM